MRVVVRIGGSVIASPPNPHLISRYAGVLRKLYLQNHKFVAVTGGGSIAREFIRVARDAGLNSDEQDEIAISISRVFAQILAIKFGGLTLKLIPTSIDEAVTVFERDGRVFMGGIKPGMTTDTVAAMMASRINADMIIKATDQDGIYNKDPRKYPEAEKIDHIRFSDLPKIFKGREYKVGIHQILDPKAIEIIGREKIRTVVLNGFKPENITAVVNGETIGTEIS